MWKTHLHSLIRQAREAEIKKWSSFLVADVPHATDQHIQPVDVSILPPCSSADAASVKHGAGSRDTPTSTNE